MRNPIPFPTRLDPNIHYMPGTVIPWYAAETKRELKQAKKNIPVGWEYTGDPKITLKPMSNAYPHYLNGSKHPIYILYLRKV